VKRKENQSVAQKLMNHAIIQPAQENLQITCIQGIGHLANRAMLKAITWQRIMKRLVKQKARHLKVTKLRIPKAKNGK
jgi:hypothetical protein